jgi:hypothetical protein
MQALEKLALAEGVDAGTMCSDALVQYILLVAPELIPSGSPVRNDRYTALKIVNQILRDAIDAGADTLLILEGDNDLVIRYSGERWQEDKYDPKYYPAQWMYEVKRRLEFMARNGGTFEVAHSGLAHKIAYSDRMPDPGLLLKIEPLS